MNVTLKEFPLDLHARLKSEAEQSGRSLNRQIIYMLDTASSPRKVDHALLLRRIEANRQKMQGKIDQDFLDQARAEGRA